MRVLFVALVLFVVGCGDEPTIEEQCATAAERGVDDHDSARFYMEHCQDVVWSS